MRSSVATPARRSGPPEYPAAVRRCVSGGSAHRDVERGPGSRPRAGDRSPADRPARTPRACGRSRARGCSTPPRSNPSGRPTPSSSTVTSRWPRAGRAVTRQRPGPVAEAVLHGVLQHLGQHHRQRGRHLRGDGAEAAVPRGSAPARPASCTSATITRSRSATSSKSTCSSKFWLSVSCTMAIEPTRRTASSSAARPSGDVDPAGLQAQQRGHGLQVVLHPVVDLADGRVLGDQLAVAAAQVGHVAQQHQRAEVLPGRPERDRPQDQHRVVVADLGVAGHPAAEHRGERLLVGTAAWPAPGHGSRRPG